MYAVYRHVRPPVSAASALTRPARLLHWREIRRIQVGRFNLVDDLAVRLGRLRYFLPLRVRSESSPILGGFVAAGMRDQVHQRVVVALIGVLRDPIADASDLMAVENIDGVIAEAGLQILQLPRRRVINAQLEHTGALGMHGWNSPSYERCQERSGGEGKRESRAQAQFGHARNDITGREQWSAGD